MDINKIFYLNNLAQENGKKYLKKRFFFSNLQSIINKDRIIGIIGPRGVGKTVILKQLLNKYDNSIYISMDTWENGGNLFEIIVDLNNRFKISHFLLDEVHYYKNFSSLLKKLYDFTNINIIFTSSVALFFSGLKKDLSRRIKLSYLHPFDFREYLYFLNDLNISPIHFETLMNKNIGKEFMGFEKYFSDYLKGGLYPFSMEVSDILDNLHNVLERIINEDILGIHDFTLRELQDIKSVLAFIGKSSIDGINYSSLSNNIGITKYKAKQYVEILEKAFVLNQIFPIGTNVKKEPKIVMTPPFRLLYSSYDFAIGGLREDFAVQILKNKGFKLYYLKSKRGEKRPDYLIKKDKKQFIIEIGGKSKGYQQFKGIDSTKYTKLIFAQNTTKKNILPLYLLGMTEV